jgi:hypothetical protein
MIKRATQSKIESDKQVEMENTNCYRIFLLSPAYAGGERARTVGAGASFESSGPSHACIMFLLESKRQERAKPTAYLKEQ